MADTGILITLEGGEGGGKSTQIPLLKTALIRQGKDVITLREPGGTVVSEQIREVVLSAKNKGKIGFTTEVLLFQAARAQIYEELVLPALAEGKIVLMDRSRDSSVVYQGLVRGFGQDWIEELNNMSTKSTYPDLTILLDVPVEIGLQRLESEGKLDRLDQEPKAFHEQVRQGYLTLAKANDRGRWRIVDASRDKETVQQELQKIIMEKLTKND